MVAARELVAVGNRRNYPLLAPVIVLAIANLLMHLQVLGCRDPVGLGWRLGIAAMIVLISVIGGRIVPAFTRNWLTARGTSALPPLPGTLDRFALGALHAAMIAWTFLPDWPPVGCPAAGRGGTEHAPPGSAGAVWQRSPEPLLLILHVGYLWLVAGVALLGLSLFSDAVPTAAAVHALTAGAMGTMILAVMTRATLGHTGRALHADAMTITIFILVTAAAVLRIAAAWPISVQVELLDVAGLAWIGAFALFAATVRTDAVGAAQVTRQYCTAGSKG